MIFKAEMVRALLDGRKTQTRRTQGLEKVNEKANFWRFTHFDGKEAVFEGKTFVDQGGIRLRCPFGVAGDRLWVRETFFIDDYRYYPNGPLPKEEPDLADNVILYRADGSCCEQLGECQCEGKGAAWRPSIHMPRWASRITLEITSVRVERVQEISPEDCKVEGIVSPDEVNDQYHAEAHWLHTRFGMLWDSINGKGAWERNDWVWVLEFKRFPTLAKC